MKKVTGEILSIAINGVLVPNVVSKMGDVYPIKLGKHWWRSVYYVKNGIEHSTGLPFNTREEAESVCIGYSFCDK